MAPLQDIPALRLEFDGGAVRLCGASSGSIADSPPIWGIFSDEGQSPDFAAALRSCGLAAGPRCGRLRFTHGRAADPDGPADPTRPIAVAGLEDSATQDAPAGSENECFAQMQISPAQASNRQRVRVHARRFRRAALETGVFGVLLFTVAASAVWAKRGGFEFSAPALAAVDRIAIAETKAAPIVAASIASVTGEPAHGEAFAAPAPEFTVERVETIDPSNAEIRYFDGRPVRPAKIIWMVTTAYSPDARSCGKWADGITASNRSVWTNGMKLVAADTKVLKMHSLVSIPGYHDGEVVPVLDRGGAIKGNRLDLLYPTHERALQWGVQRLPVTVWEYAD